MWLANRIPRRGSLALGLACAMSILAAPPAWAATQMFGFTGGEQTYTVPAGVHFIHVLAVGAPGGRGTDSGADTGGPAGFGDRLEADLPVTPGQALFIEVGGRGADGAGIAGGGAGGFNGGGGSTNGGFAIPGGGGGGGTDLRTCSRLAASCAGAPDSLSSRLLVAGGGGGGGSSAFTALPTDGQGGDAGEDGQAGGAGGGGTVLGGGGGTAGTLTFGGAGGMAGSSSPPAGNPGAFGQGGAAGTGGDNSEPGGGGGGGYFGGGAGGSANGAGAGGGGGGSNFAAASASVLSSPTDTTGTALVSITSVDRDFKLGRLTRNRHHGTATLTVDLPGPGTLGLSGAVRRVSKTLTTAGKVKLMVRAEGRAARRLRLMGKLKLRASVTFTPMGADPISRERLIKLVRGAD